MKLLDDAVADMEATYLGNGVYAYAEGELLWFFSHNGHATLDRVSFNPDMLVGLVTYIGSLMSQSPGLGMKVQAGTERAERDSD